MNSLAQFDKAYIQSIKATFSQLEDSYYNIHANYEFDLTKTEITEVILERLKAYYATQGRIKLLLDKRYLAAGPDFFVESVLFFLKLYLQAIGSDLEAHSERQIRKARNAIRPDISIWRNDEIVAVIECKTQLGFGRNTWEKQYLEKHSKLQNEYPKAKSFLLVMTGKNWGGFGGYSDLGQKYFCLLNDIWPVDYLSPSQIMTPIENLFNLL